MLPLVVRIHVMNRSGNRVRLWIPLFLLWLLLLPFVLVVLPVLFVVCIVADFDPVPAAHALWGILSGFSGTHIEFEAPDASVFVHVY